MDVAEDEVISLVPLICDRYRVFLAAEGHQEHERRMREAITENIELLRTDLWWPALKVVERYVETSPAFTVITTDTDEHCRWLVDAKTNDYIYDTVRSWWVREQTRFVWNPAKERFVFVDPYAAYDDDELRVAGMAGTLGAHELPPRPRLDWDIIFAGTKRLPRGCRCGGD